MADYKGKTNEDNDLWLMQGDCLERMREIPDGSVDLVLTDPPYGTTACKWDSVIDLALMWKELKRVIKPNGAIILMANEPFTSVLVCSNLKQFKYRWDWEKSQAVGHLNAWKQPLRCIEDICVFYSKPCTYNPQLVDKPLKNQRPQSGRSGQTDCYGEYKLDVYKCPPDKSMPKNILKYNNVQGNIHPTQKPVELMEYLIKTYTNEGETVLDFTMGSGTTIKAANNLNRNSIGIEMGHCEKKGHKYEGMEWTDVLLEELQITK